jgi:hypothetical protein
MAKVENILKTMHAIHDESKKIKPYVIICQPRRDLKETPAQNFDGYEGLHIDLLGFTHAFCNIGGEKVDVARNYLFEQALESDAKYMLFVGEDTVLPYDGFLKLHETAEKNPNSCIVGVYYIKISSQMLMIKTEDNFIVPANAGPNDKPFEVWQAGMDAMLIPIHIIKKLRDADPENVFCCIGHKIEDLPFIGEDNYFYYRLRENGFNVICDPRVQALHCDLESGLFTAHPDIDLNNYITNIPMTGRLEWKHKRAIDERWLNRLPKGTAAPEQEIKKE